MSGPLGGFFLTHTVHAQHRPAQCSHIITTRETWNDSSRRLWSHHRYRYRYSVSVSVVSVNSGISLSLFTLYVYIILPLIKIVVYTEI